MADDARPVELVLTEGTLARGAWLDAATETLLANKTTAYGSESREKVLP